MSFPPRPSFPDPDRGRRNECNHYRTVTTGDGSQWHVDCIHAHGHVAEQHTDVAGHQWETVH